VRVERLPVDGDPAGAAARVRALAPIPPSVEGDVAEILAMVRDRGDQALLELTRRLDTQGAEPRPLRVTRKELEAALAALDPELSEALELAARNVRGIARTGQDFETAGREGQSIRLRRIPVRRAGVYAPAGRAPYPSTVVMGVMVARAAGVEEIVVCAPPGPDGEAHPVMLAACTICDANEVYRMGGAQAIAALAYGTHSVAPVDVIVGPGNPYVQEAKRQLAGRVGIDGIAGPSELLVLLDGDSPVRLVALDLLAQAEHGRDSLVAAASPSPEALDALEAELAALAPDRPTVQAAACALVHTADLGEALAFAESLAPEHLQLMGAGPEALARQVRSAGCLFVGASSATAFGDYVAGSNHILPTGGAARFASALGPSLFRRRMAEVRIGRAAGALAGPGTAIARSEGFFVHAESMEARAAEDDAPMGENRGP